MLRPARRGCADSRFRSGGIVVRVFSHRGLVALGDYAFEVYLFQWPVVWLFHLAIGEWPLSAEAFVFFVVSLWAVSALYAENVAPALVGWARQAVGR